MSGKMLMTREMAKQALPSKDVQEVYDVLATYWPPNPFMKFHAYDWVAGEDAEVFCVLCAAKVMQASPERETMPLGTIHPIGEDMFCECGFVFDLSEDDEMYEDWINGKWNGDTYDWQPY